jgi:hypothetical protein
MYDMDLLDEMEHKEEDESILTEIENKKRAARKSFSSVVNKRKLSRYELDEVMV